MLANCGNAEYIADFRIADPLDPVSQCKLPLIPKTAIRSQFWGPSAGPRCSGNGSLFKSLQNHSCFQSQTTRKSLFEFFQITFSGHKHSFSGTEKVIWRAPKSDFDLDIVILE